jgi:hypothetical protein
MLKADIESILRNFEKPDLIDRIARDRKTGLARNKTRSILLLGQTVSAIKVHSGEAGLGLATFVTDYRFRRIIDIESRFFNKFNRVGENTAFYQITF